ncbi:flavodoxin family protein [Clostridium chromiireducens]|uniref:flavodoxin family protein n=1 Tax=Clostridium chromiireducens TaxID=225345 RepID=UPI003AF8A46B
MNVLIVFYSLNGHVRFLSEMIAENFNPASTDTVELKLEKELPESIFRRNLLAAREFLFNGKPKLNNKPFDFSKYDLIFLGTPIWGTITPAMNTLLSENRISKKKIAFFTSCDGGSPNRAYSKMEKLLVDNHIIGKINFVNPEPQDIDNIRKRVKEWINSIIDYRGKK